MISENFKKRLFTSFFLILILFLMISYDPIFLYALLVIGIFSIIEFVDIIKKINIKYLPRLF